MKVLAGVGRGAFALLFLVVGLSVICMMVESFVLISSQNTVTTTGTVVGINNWTESGDKYYSPDVEFTTEEGQQLTVNMWCPPFGCFAESAIGSQVPVVYPRSHPQGAIANTFAGRWLNPLLVLAVGIIITLIGAVRLIMVIRR